MVVPLLGWVTKVDLSEKAKLDLVCKTMWQEVHFAIALVLPPPPRKKNKNNCTHILDES